MDEQAASGKRSIPCPGASVSLPTRRLVGSWELRSRLPPIDEQTGRVDQTRQVPCGRPCAGTVFAGLGTASSAEHTVSVDMSPAGQNSARRWSVRRRSFLKGAGILTVDITRSLGFSRSRVRRLSCTWTRKGTSATSTLICAKNISAWAARWRT